MTVMHSAAKAAYAACCTRSAEPFLLLMPVSLHLIESITNVTKSNISSKVCPIDCMSHLCDWLADVFDEADGHDSVGVGSGVV